MHANVFLLRQHVELEAFFLPPHLHVHSTGLPVRTGESFLPLNHGSNHDAPAEPVDGW